MRLTTHLNGVPIITNFTMANRVEVVRRVPGGHLNRWLVRELGIEIRPWRKVVHDKVNNRMFCHPDILAEIVASGGKL